MNVSLKYVYFLSAPMLVGGWLISNHYLPWAAFYNELLAALAMLALAVAGFSAQQPLSLPRPAILVLLLACVPLIQFAFGLIDFLGDAALATSYLAGLSLSIVIGANLARAWGGRFVEALAWVCLLGAMASVVLALHQWLGLQQLGIWLMDMPPNGRPYANLAQPNNLATLFCLGLIAAIYLRERGQLGRFVLALLAVMLFSGIAMTRSRTAVFIMAVIAGWIVWGGRRFGLKCSSVEVAMGVAVFATLWAGWSTLSDWLYVSADSTFSRVNSAFTGEARLVLWQQLLDALSRQPVSGYGWGQVSVAQIAVAAEHPYTAPAEYGHNLIVDLLVWNGALLGGGIVGVAAWWLVSQARKVNSAESWFGLLFIFVVGMHGMFELPHAYTYFLLPVGLCIGIVSHRQMISTLRLSRRAYGAYVLIGVVVVGWIFVEYQKIETDHRLMRFESIGLERRAADAVAPKVVLLTQLEAFIRFARTQAREGMTEEEIRWMETVTHRYPSPPTLMRYALALGLNHRPQEAALELQRLKQTLPPDQFGEAHYGWMSLVSRYPQLKRVPLPAD